MTDEERSPSAGNDAADEPYGEYDPDEIRGPLSGRADGDVAGIRSPGSNGHGPGGSPDDRAPAAGSEDADPPGPSFVEVQQFRQRWAWAAFLLLAAYAVVTVAFNDVGTALAAALVGVPVAVISLLYAAKLRTEVDEEGIHVRFFPFHRSPRTIPFEEVVEYEAVEYDPVREYYGWGIRRAPKGWAYNVAGNEGVRIDRDPEVSVLIGSQRPEELEDAIATGVAMTDTVAHQGGDRGPKWRAVAQIRDEDDRSLQ